MSYMNSTNEQMCYDDMENDWTPVKHDFQQYFRFISYFFRLGRSINDCFKECFMMWMELGFTFSWVRPTKDDDMEVWMKDNIGAEVVIERAAITGILVNCIHPATLSLIIHTWDVSTLSLLCVLYVILLTFISETTL